MKVDRQPSSLPEVFAPCLTVSHVVPKNGTIRRPPARFGTVQPRTRVSPFPPEEVSREASEPKGQFVVGREIEV